MAECPICNHIKKTCKRLGDETICEQAIEDVKEDKITAEEMIDKIGDRFGKESFKKAWEGVIGDEKADKKEHIEKMG